MRKCFRGNVLLFTAILFIGCNTNSSQSVQSPSQSTQAQIEKVKPERVSPQFQKFAEEFGYNPHAHHEVLDYFRKLWAGEPRNAAFEALKFDENVEFS